MKPSSVAKTGSGLFLSPRHRPKAHLFLLRKRDVEIHMLTGAALMVGVPPHNFPETFRLAVSGEA